jgi:hypothetical protein
VGPFVPQGDIYLLSRVYTNQQQAALINNSNYFLVADTIIIRTIASTR